MLVLKEATGARSAKIAKAPQGDVEFAPPQQASVLRRFARELPARRSWHLRPVERQVTLALVPRPRDLQAAPPREARNVVVHVT